MIRCSHKTLILISGAIWMAVGLYLLPLGLKFLLAGMPGNYPLLSALGLFLGGTEMAALCLAAAGLYVGYLKGRFVLGKSARQGIDRIRSFSNPANLSSLYSAKYYILLGGMMLLGILMNVLSVPLDIRGFVDVAVGAALINGSLIYFRGAFSAA